jgi:arginine/serine-rich splicing factor 4/5/6
VSVLGYTKMFRLLLKYSVLEYLFRDDADRAVRELDGKELRGRPVRVTLDESVRVLDFFCFFQFSNLMSHYEQRGGPDNYRRDERRDDRDRYKEDRYDKYRRDRSRSPRRGEFEERRPRSPPPKRDYDDRRPAGYDDYRRGGYDDRRPPDYYDDRRRDDYDRKRDDRRRDEKDFDDRAARAPNGDSVWR